MKKAIDWRNRIVGYTVKPANQFLAHPNNWRRHPKAQQQAVVGSLNELGWIDVVLENVVTGHLIDGHERIFEALAKGDETLVPCLQVELSEDEEPLAMLVIDPTAAMAETDKENLDTLLQDVRTGDAGIMAMLAELAKESGLDYGRDEATDNPTPEVARQTLAERFIVPPFSVLDARQGYWQERKRAWLALGIQSELGRGENVLDMSASSVGITDPDAVAAWNKQRRESPRHTLGAVAPNQSGTNGILTSPGKYAPGANGLLGFSEQARTHYKGAAPGGSPRPATRLEDGHTIRGDGRGRGLARCFGQDLMRGENVTFLETGSQIKGNLWHGGTSESTLKVAEVTQTGTSIFDPVLCELVYRWFCPPDGKILDPFAGGSVRGIVAAVLGRHYTGIDLSERQLEANREQAAEIIGKAALPIGDTVPVVVSGKWAHHAFGCTAQYITTTCKGSCCEGSDRILISLLPDEQKAQEAAGFTVKDGLLQPDPRTGKCPHKQANGLCGVHGTALKPFGCIASPFTLNSGNTLIVRNRYSLMKCHGQGEPAYKVFRASLDLIFGEAEAQRISDVLDGGAGNVAASMPRDSYEALRYLDGLKHGMTGEGGVQWIEGDALDCKALAPDAYDLFFTCPPYADLEVYSDDPRDLSTMDYPAFLASYRRIIADGVSMLADNRFAVICVGDVRDKKGYYRNFVSDTIAAFHSAGATLYNEAVLVTAVGSLPIRVGKQFSSGRKLGKTHQNVLVFVKGDWRKAVEDCGAVDVSVPEELEA